MPSSAVLRRTAVPATIRWAQRRLRYPRSSGKSRRGTQTTRASALTCSTTIVLIDEIAPTRFHPNQLKQPSLNLYRESKHFPTLQPLPASTDVVLPNLPVSNPPVIAPTAVVAFPPATVTRDTHCVNDSHRRRCFSMTNRPTRTLRKPTTLKLFAAFQFTRTSRLRSCHNVHRYQGCRGVSASREYVPWSNVRTKGTSRRLGVRTQ